MENNKIINTEKLPPEVQDKFIPYLKLMSDIHKSHLISVFIYDPATGKNYIPKISDINSVFVFKGLAFSSLTDSLKEVSKGISKRIAAPLFLTKEHIETSLDVFPIEFFDMKENYILLYGADVLSDLTLNENFLALQAQLEGTENRIAVERMRYNRSVKDFNRFQRLFFGRFFAAQAGVTEPAVYFEAVESASRSAGSKVLIKF